MKTLIFVCCFSALVDGLFLQIPFVCLLIGAGAFCVLIWGAIKGGKACYNKVFLLPCVVIPFFLSVLVGTISERFALNEAYEIRSLLVNTQQNMVQKEFSRICREAERLRCGFLGYKIILLKNPVLNDKGDLLVLGFSGRRILVDVETGNRFIRQVD